MVKVLLSVAAVAVVAVNLVSAEVSQVHLGVSSPAANCANGIAVSFATDDDKSYPVSATAEGGSTISADSTFVTYSVSEPEYNYTYSSPYLHTALLCDLLETTKYSYTIGSEFTGSFVSLLHPGSDKDETILGVIGDPGDTSSSESTLAGQAKTFEGKHIQALVVAGDYAYANGQHLQWDNWFTEQQNLTSIYPLTGINGNHETVTSSGHLNLPPYPEDMELEAENYLAYVNRLYSPISEDAKTALRTWYSMDIGLIHIVFLDDYTGSSGTNTTVVGTEKWLADRNAQLEWVKKDLQSVDRSVTPWVIVVKHNPFYNTWSNHQCQCSSTIFEIDEADVEKCWNGTYYSGTVYLEPGCGLMAKLEDVFSANRVDVVLTGHVHAYERTTKIYKNKEDATNGVYYVTTGSGGNYEGHAGPRLDDSEIPSWSLAANNVTFGGSRVIATRESFRFLWFANDVTTAEAVPTDGFTIVANGSDIITWPQTSNSTDNSTSSDAGTVTLEPEVTSEPEIDFTESNTWTGKMSFGGRCLHYIDPTGATQNPYQSVISAIGRTLEAFDDDNIIPAFGFGDSRTRAERCFPFSRGRGCQGFDEVLKRYNEITPQIQLHGPTSFAPVIQEAIKAVKEDPGYHILVIIADGRVNQPSPTRNAIVEASKYPISIIMVGVGDGPWELMEEFDDQLPARRFDNFQFVEYNKVLKRNMKNPEAGFAMQALMEIPEQYQTIRKLGLLNY
ncbi:hypothetical protein PF010_g14013 [Phytophthora fragariae]|uniref:Purple acid phosphatase n=1 Tax=Phytophthora fragariae TaxID=53985 RepID=A0A6G0KZ41_9STRA|nr:hypothetical protein PF010_g14013 [Phytophthora fragariae]